MNIEIESKIRLNVLEKMTESWHKNLAKSNITLQEFLGLSDRQFNLFLLYPRKLEGEEYEREN